MNLNLTDEQRRRLIERVTRRVIERLAREATVTQTVLPCAIPPPGSPRYEAVMHDTENHGGPALEVEAPLGEIAAYVQGGASRVTLHYPSSLEFSPESAPRIEYNFLARHATDHELAEFCREALRLRIGAVRVEPRRVPLCAGVLKNSGVKVRTFVGFPFGGISTNSKVQETRQVIGEGADEIDLMPHVARLGRGDFAYVLDEMKQVIAAAMGRKVTIIIESSMLTNDQKISAGILARAAGAHFVRTASGWVASARDRTSAQKDIALLQRFLRSDSSVPGGEHSILTEPRVDRASSIALSIALQNPTASGPHGQS